MKPISLEIVQRVPVHKRTAGSGDLVQLVKPTCEKTEKLSHCQGMIIGGVPDKDVFPKCCGFPKRIQ